MSAAAIVIGALVGAGTAKAMGGDPVKGAMYGAAGGGIGGAINPYSLGGSTMIASSATVGAVAGGAAGGVAAGGIGPSIIKGPSGGQVPPPLVSPMTVGYASQAEREKRSRRKGYGSTILAGGELGVASTQRKQILG